MTARFATPLLALCALASAGLAQESKPLNFSVRLGVFQPSNGLARDEGKSWFAAISYALIVIHNVAALVALFAWA